MAPLPIVNLWNKRSLIFHFSVLEIKTRYKESYLGFMWAFLEPLLIFTLLYTVFTSLREYRIDFAIYLITGVMIHHVFAKGTIGGLSSLQNNHIVIKTLNIRREFFPITSTGAIILLMFADVGTFLVLMPVFHFAPTWTIALFPLVIGLLILLILGLSYILSIVFVYIKDIQPVWSIFVYTLIFVSPVFWYLDEAKPPLTYIQDINPLGQLIELGHKVVLGQIPSLSDWLYTSLFVFGILFIGYAIFQKYEAKIVEVL